MKCGVTEVPSLVYAVCTVSKTVAGEPFSGMDWAV